MQIPDEVLKCVAFLYSKDRDGVPSAIGTCFFLGYELPDNLGTVSYAVTARHVIKNADKDGCDGRSHIRLNKMGGGVEWIAMPFSSWVFHDDPRVDLAITWFGADWTKWDHFHIPREMIVNDAVLGDYLVGPGEDLFFPGLFVEHQGNESNAPIMRIGTIAAMPGEHVMSQGDVPSVVYLAECRSIGGLSGSPVFINVGGIRRHKDGKQTMGGLVFYLLGTIKGHWDETRTAIVDIALRDRLDERINMGIAMVVPSSYISELLEQPSVSQPRNAAAEERRQITKAQRSLPVDD